MKRIYIYLVILIISFGIMIYGIIGLLQISNLDYKENISKGENFQNIHNNNDVVVTSVNEIKVTPNTKFALKKFYDECSHFEYEEAELPIELVNLTRQEIEDYYSDWEVEELTEKKLVLCKEINGYCKEHFLIKLDGEKVNIYRLNTDGKFLKYKDTSIVKEYLTNSDIQKLSEGITVYGEGKLSSVLEDFE